MACGVVLRGQYMVCGMPALTARAVAAQGVTWLQVYFSIVIPLTSDAAAFKKTACTLVDVKIDASAVGPIAAGRPAVVGVAAQTART